MRHTCNRLITERNIKMQGVCEKSYVQHVLTRTSYVERAESESREKPKEKHGENLG